MDPRARTSSPARRAGTSQREATLDARADDETRVEGPGELGPGASSLDASASRHGLEALFPPGLVDTAIEDGSAPLSADDIAAMMSSERPTTDALDEEAPMSPEEIARMLGAGAAVSERVAPSDATPGPSIELLLRSAEALPCATEADALLTFAELDDAPAAHEARASRGDEAPATREPHARVDDDDATVVEVPRALDDDDEAPMTPEEIAALFGGGGAPVSAAKSEEQLEAEMLAELEAEEAAERAVAARASIEADAPERAGPDGDGSPRATSAVAGRGEEVSSAAGDAASELGDIDEGPMTAEEIAALMGGAPEPAAAAGASEDEDEGPLSP
ncbi:hypothetical protein L6R52_39065, partial [Myxococcota bacterium]|nr:hypothetical protein [Myxococcota bacterium]